MIHFIVIKRKCVFWPVWLCCVQVSFCAATQRAALSPGCRWTQSPPEKDLKPSSMLWSKSQPHEQREFCRYSVLKKNKREWPQRSKEIGDQTKPLYSLLKNGRVCRYHSNIVCLINMWRLLQNCHIKKLLKVLFSIIKQEVMSVWNTLGKTAADS